MTARRHFHRFLEWFEFVAQVSALEYDESVRNSVALLGGDILLHQFDEVRQWHYGAADNEVELLFLFLCAFLLAHYVVQSECLCNFCGYFDFLAD